MSAERTHQDQLLQYVTVFADLSQHIFNFICADNYQCDVTESIKDRAGTVLISNVRTVIVCWHYKAVITNSSFFNIRLIHKYTLTL